MGCQGLSGKDHTVHMRAVGEGRQADHFRQRGIHGGEGRSTAPRNDEQLSGLKLRTGQGRLAARQERSGRGVWSSQMGCLPA